MQVWNTSSYMLLVPCGPNQANPRLNPFILQFLDNLLIYVTSWFDGCDKIQFMIDISDHVVI